MKSTKPSPIVTRTLEIFLGLAMVLLILGNYGDQNTPMQPIVAYFTENSVLRLIIYIVLFILAFRLIGGKSKDYSKFFYSLLVKIYGDPKRSNRSLTFFKRLPL